MCNIGEEKGGVAPWSLEGVLSRSRLPTAALVLHSFGTPHHGSFSKAREILRKAINTNLRDSIQSFAVVKFASSSIRREGSTF